MKALENLLWLDLEMTGLNYKRDRIIEIACIVTDKDLNILAVGPNLPIKVSRFKLSRMDEWNKIHHKESGLVQRIREAGVPVKKAEKMVLDFVKEFCVEGKTILAGSSVHVDKRFIDKDMPHLAKYLHYRILDISSIRELSKRWYPDLEEFKGKDSHRALDDIEESIEMLKFMRDKIFK